MSGLVRRFLILGCQRSGTTLLGMALQAHPDIALIEEDDRSYHRPAELTRQLDLDAVRHFDPPGADWIGFKAPRETHRIEAIVAALGDVKLLWIDRGVYPVVASMLALQNASGQSWATCFAPLEIEKAIRTGVADPAICDGFQRARTLVDAGRRAVSLAALCWLVKRDSVRQAERDHPQGVHRLSYEQLVTAPRAALSGVLGFLGLPWDDVVLTHQTTLSGERPGGANPRRPIDRAGLSRWQSALSAEDRALIDAIVQRHRMAKA